MSRAFYHTTAELVVRVTEAVHVSQGATTQAVQAFCDLSERQARDALALAEDIGLLRLTQQTYLVSSPLVRFISSPSETRKASILRFALEAYEPFVVFRERLFATGSADTAAQQTVALLELETHREDVKDTLISLATYTNSVRTEGGGRFSPEQRSIENHLTELADACADLAAAEQRVRVQLRLAADVVSRDDVIKPLASALLKAKNGNASDAVTDAGNAFESYLSELAERMGVNLGNATGINSKLDKFRSGNQLPKKIVEAAKYLGQVRNAAGHGVDPDIQASWIIHYDTGVEYVFVCCSMIAACHEREVGSDFRI